MKFCVMTIFVGIYLQSVAGLYCYWNNGCEHKYFVSKTPYDAVRGDIRDSMVKLTNCEAISIWGLVRHGKRNPGIKTSIGMQQAIVIRDYIVSSYVNGNSSLCAQDIENLRVVPINYETFEKNYQLSEEGFEELVGIGSRIKEAFPKLLTDLEKGSYTFRPAFGKWMDSSAYAFTKGIEDNNNFEVEQSIIEFDTMAPYATCEKYQRGVKKNPAILAEVNQYQETSEFLAMKERVQRRLGIDYVLTNENITALYDLCRFTWSSKTKMSPWCALFTTDDLKVLEYLGDLRHYYRKGYGAPINQQLGQIPMADLLKSFQEAKDGKGKKIITYFTHSTMMDMVLTALNLFKDEIPLTGKKRYSERKWRASKLSAFSTNLLAVLNRCNKDGDTDFNVVFYFNEEPLIPICKRGVCSWQEFENMLKNMSKSTDYCD